MVAIVQNDEVNPGGLVVARIVGERDGRPAPGTTRTGSATPIGGQLVPEQVVDLRGRRGMHTAPSLEAAGGRGPTPPRIPGWRFVDDGTAIAFSDGHAWRRTIVLPTKLSDRPEQGLRRVLRAMGGLHPSRRYSITDLDRIRGLTLLLVVTTEYRELLHEAAVAGFERPLLVERDLRLLLHRNGDPATADGSWDADHGSLRIELDRFTFKGSRYTRTAAARLVSSLHEDVDGGQLSVHPSGDRPWELLGISPVGVFAAATACRMTAAESRRYRGRPAGVAAELLDPHDPTLPVPGDDLVVELEGLCRGTGHAGSR
jgi:hypothetical protein